ncbi:putative spermidine/putrescine transport system substrate-binding protein [Rhodobacter sp. 140A]|nr:putative spermidine/putrescine transport system substrate-binding protein [Rhodobacter sp. 140A]
MKLERRQFLTALGACAGAAAFGSRAFANAPFVVPTYGGTWAKFWEETLMPGLTKATGIPTQLDIGLGKDFVSKIRAGGDQAPYSVFMGNENIAAMLRAEGFFEPLDMAKLPNAAQLHDGLVNTGNNGLRAIVSPIGLAYRTDMVKDAPTSWTDLWENPEFKERIGLYQIGNTGAQLFLRPTGKLFGSGDTDFDTAFKKIQELVPFTQASWSGEVAAGLMRGDVIVAPVDWTEIMMLQDKGAPVAIVAPKEGVLAFEQSFNIVKTGAMKDEAHAYINYLIDKDVQANMAQAFYTSPSNKDSVLDPALAARLPINGPKMSEIIRFDWDSYVDLAPAVTDRWNREIG